MSEPNYAVLTGDVVQSGQLKKSNLSDVQSALKSATMAYEQVFPETVVGSLGITRGDGWQVALKRPDQSLRLALYLRSSLKAKFSVDTRVSIGIGTVDSLVISAIVESTGPAFELSGRGLDDLPKHLRMDLRTDPAHEEGQMLVRLMDCVVQRWSATESRAVAGTLVGKTQEEIAAASPASSKSGKSPTRQAVAAALKRAAWDSFSESLAFTEKLICKL